MSYTHGKRSQTFLALTGESVILSQTPADKAFLYPVTQPWVISGFAATILVAMTVTSAVWTLTNRPTPASGTGEVTIGTLTCPVTGSAIGQSVYKKIREFRCLPGSEIVLKLTTASTAGSVVFGLEINEFAEIPSNNTKMILSA